MNWVLAGFCLALMLVTMFADSDTSRSLGATAWFLLAMLAVDKRGISPGSER